MWVRFLLFAQRAQMSLPRCGTFIIYYGLHNRGPLLNTNMIIEHNNNISHKEAKRIYKRCLKAFVRMKLDAEKSGLKLKIGYDLAAHDRLNDFKQDPYRWFEGRFMSDTNFLKEIIKSCNNNTFLGKCPFEKIDKK